MRHRQVFLFFLGMIFAYALRVIFSVAIVAMTDKKINNDFTVIFINFFFDQYVQNLTIKNFFSYRPTIGALPRSV